ncbi:MAG: hypothetical protein ABSG95_01160 [Solirubrobacteraceae bacterium]
MSRFTIGRRAAPRVALSAALALLLLPAAAQAAPRQSGRPRAFTGLVAHVRGTSAVLEGTVNPSGHPTTYYFQYGPTRTYASQTPSTSVGSGVTTVKVAQAVTGLLAGYHYRIVASNEKGPSFGQDRVYPGKKGALRIVFAKKATRVDVFGSPFTVIGTVSGLGGGGRDVILQSSPFPYLTPFTTIGAPVLTNAGGVFVFHVARLLASTQFRVITLAPRPLYSPTFTEHVAVRVSFHVRTAGPQGLVRLYGTVTPAKLGARILFQVQKAVRPGKSEKTEERTSKFVTQLITRARKGTKSFSRFSLIASIPHGGRYRAFVEVPTGALASGVSQSIVLHAAPAKGGKGKKKKG